VNTRESAQANLGRAEVILGEAESLQAKNIWNLAVRRAQEAVELALKGALLWIGLEVPRVHDVGPFIRQHVSRFPEPFSQHIPRLISVSRSLSVERERSFYGDEESGLPPEMLYSEGDAAEAIEKAKFVLEVCHELLDRRIE
jgi:HEPN domain-containing protein